MDIVPASYFDNIKRYWRRRKYQRLDDGRKRVKIARLGNRTRRSWKIRLVPKLRFKLVDAMIRLVVGKKVEKKKPLPMISASTNEVVDGRMVMEIYKRLVSTREFAGLLV
ncbi:hypothetical protein NMG60_11018900 [Bertholletia excelsa]